MVVAHIPALAEQEDVVVTLSNAFATFVFIVTALLIAGTVAVVYHLCWC